MPTISDIRDEYPQYDDMTDADLVGAFHKKYYPDLNLDQVANAMGYKPPKAPEQSAWRRVGDVAVDVAKGGVLAGEAMVGLTDLATGGLAGRGMEAIGYDPKRTNQMLEAGYSDARLKSNQEYDQATGVVDTAGALVTNPGLVIGKIAESAPMLLGIMGAAGRAYTAAKVAGLTDAAALARASTVASVGEGAMTAGQIAEQARQENPDEIAKMYYALPAGAATALISKVVGKLPGGSLETMFAGRGAGAITGNALTRTGKGIVAEGLLEEGTQSAQEQAFTNLATNKPVEEGVGKAWASGTIIGGAQGGMMAGLHGAKQKPTIDDIGINNDNVSLDDALSTAEAIVSNSTTVTPEDSLLGATNPYDVGGFVSRGQEGQETTIDEPQQGIFGGGGDVASPDLSYQRAVDMGAGNAPPELSDVIQKGQSKDQAFAQREAALTTQEAQDREAGINQLAESGRDIQVDQANALTSAQGFDALEPTLMQIKMQEAAERRKLMTTPVSKREARAQALRDEKAAYRDAPINTIRLGNTEAPQSAVVNRYDQQGNRITSKDQVQNAVRAENAVASSRSASESNSPGSQYTSLSDPRGSISALAQDISTPAPSKNQGTSAKDGGQGASPGRVGTSQPAQQAQSSALQSPLNGVKNDATATATILPDADVKYTPANKESANVKLANSGNKGGNSQRRTSIDRDVQASAETRPDVGAIQSASNAREISDAPTPGRGEGREVVAAPRAVEEAAPTSAQQQRTKTQADDALVGQAESILDAANVRGKDRIEALKDIKRGDITVDELARAHQPSATDRRKDAVKRKRVSEMTADERATELLTSPLTGIGSKRAFEEHVQDNPKDHVLYGDIDDFKAINAKYGHNEADQILRAIGDAKADIGKQMGVKPFHRSGDEFLATHADPATLEAYGKAVQERLAEMSVEIINADGSTVMHKGTGFSYGTGKTDKAAEGKSDEQKIERKRLGLRTGQRDVDAVPGPATAGVEDQEGVLRGLSDKPDTQSKTPPGLTLEAATRLAKQFGDGTKVAPHPTIAGKYVLESRNADRTSGMPAAEVNKAITRLRAKWLGFTKVNTVQSVDDLPQTILDRSQPNAQTEGFYDPQTHAVYLIADNISDAARSVHVASHEVIGHAGLRMLKDKTINQALNIAGANKFINDLAAAIKTDRGNVTREIAIEEAIAEYAAAIETGDMQALTNRYGVTVPTTAQNGIKATIARVYEAVKRFLAAVMGKPAADVSDADVRALIGEQRAAVEGQESSVREPSGDPVLASTRADQTKTAAFRKWFGDSKVVNENGDPVVLYHATKSDFNEFSPDGRGAFGRGIYLSGMPNRLTQYWGGFAKFGDKFGPDGGNIMPVYVRLENPAALQDVMKIHPTDKESRDKYIALQQRLIRAGHDGAISMINGKVWEAVVFSPSQIKSAIGNSGAFDPGNPDIRFSTSRIIGDTDRYDQRQRAAFKNVGREIEVPTFKERMAVLWKDAGKKMAQGLVDQFAPIKELSEKAYGLMRLSKGAGGAFEVLLRGGHLKLTDGVYNFDATKKGGVVDRLLVPLQGEADDFLWWVSANRAEQLSKQDREHLFGAADIAVLKSLDGGAAKFDYKLQHGANAGQVTRDRTLIYRDALKTFNEFHKNTLDMAEQSGLIDPVSRKFWESEFYVPFYRVSEEDEGGVRGMNVKSGVVRQEAFKHLRGGTDKLNSDLLENTLMNWAHLLDSGAKNRAAGATLDAAVKTGIAIEATEDVARQLGKSIGKSKNVVWHMDGGAKRFYLVDDPYVMTALSALEYAGMKGPLMDALGTMKRVLTIGVTASPYFKIRNLIRDSVQAIGTSPLSYNVAGNLKEGWRLTDPKSEAYFRLLAGGGTIHFGTMLEGSESKRVRALVEAGVDDATILNDEGKLKKFYKRIVEPAVDAYQELGNRGEAINRAALYKQLTDKGMDHSQASLMARDLMDFSMGGAWTGVRFLTQVVPFMNARMQGLYKLGKAAKEDPAKFGAVLGATAIFSIGLMLAYSGDDDWKKREDWDRDNYWWFKIGGEAFRIPKPFEIGAIATLAERGIEYFSSDEMTGKRFTSRLLHLLSDNLSMNPVPQLVKPVLDVYANKDSFSGRPIETMGMEHLKSEYRFNGQTSMAARAISTAGNAIKPEVLGAFSSPVQIDHMIRGYFGWLGSFIVGTGDLIARPATGQVRGGTPDYWKVATGGMVSDAESPSSRYVSQMYEQAKILEEAYGTYRALAKEGKIAEAQEFAQGNAEKLRRYKSVEQVKRSEARFNEIIRVIERSTKTPDEKREMIRQIQRQKDLIARKISG